MSHVLCPIDFSPCSLTAIEFAIAMASKLRAKLTLFHVFTEQAYNEIVDQDHLGKSFKEKLAIITNRLEELTGQVRQNPASEGIDCDHRIDLGTFVDKLTDVTEECKFDFVVMGTIGGGKSHGSIFGSNTQKVIEEVKVPLLLVPEEATYVGFGRIIYASDFSENDKIAILRTISMATHFDARIKVLHVNQGESDEKYTDLLENLKSFVQYDKIDFFQLKSTGKVGEVIDKYMEEEKGELLIVFKQDRSFVENIFHKSLTKELAFSTNKPLLVFK